MLLASGRRRACGVNKLRIRNKIGERAHAAISALALPPGREIPSRDPEDEGVNNRELMSGYDALRVVRCCAFLGGWAGSFEPTDATRPGATTDPG